MIGKVISMPVSKYEVEIVRLDVDDIQSALFQKVREKMRSRD